MSKDESKNRGEIRQSGDSKKLLNRREALGKVGLYALSATTMMVLMKSQAKAQTSVPTANTATKPPNTNWQRTTPSSRN